MNKRNDCGRKWRDGEKWVGGGGLDCQLKRSVAPDFIVDHGWNGGFLGCASAQLFEVPAAVRSLIHLVTTDARALRVGIGRGSDVAATQAHKGTLRPLQHRPETTAQDTVGAAYDLGQHSLQFSLLFTAGTGQEVSAMGLQGLAAELSSTAFWLL